MKIKSLFMVIVLCGLFVDQAFAKNVDWSDYHRRYYDFTFFYNMLEVKSNEDKLHFESSSQLISNYAKILDLPSDADWGSMQVDFSIPLDNCSMSLRENRVVICVSSLLEIVAYGSMNGSELQLSAEIPHVEVQIRKIHSLLRGGGDKVQYEMVITQGEWGKGNILFIQNYFEQ